MAARRTDIPGPIEVIDDGLVVVAGALPEAYLGTIASYLILDERGRVHIVDPGWDSEENWNGLLAGLDVLGRGVDDVQSIVITHLHSDHLGMTYRLREDGRPAIVMHRVEQEAITAMLGELRDDPAHDRLRSLMSGWGAPAELLDELVTGALINYPGAPFDADVLVEHGSRLDIPGREIHVLWTPGHTRGSMCLVEPAASRIFTGDSVLPRLHPGLGLGGDGPTNALADYYASLDSLESFADFQVLPGHDGRFDALAPRMAVTRAHHERRSAEVAEALSGAPEGDVWTTASRVRWSAGWENLAGPYLYSALAQTAMHIEYLRSRGE